MDLKCKLVPLDEQDRIEARAVKMLEAVGVFPCYFFRVSDVLEQYQRLSMEQAAVIAGEAADHFVSGESVWRDHVELAAEREGIALEMPSESYAGGVENGDSGPAGYPDTRESESKGMA